MSDRKSGKTLVGNFLSCCIGVFIQYALDFQSRSGNSVFNQLLKDGYGSQRTSLHTDGNPGKKTAFNLIIFGATRRIMAYVNLQSGFPRKIRRILLEHPSIVPVTAATIGGKQQLFGVRIIKFTAQIPPSADALHRKPRGVRACGKVHKACILLDVIQSVRRGANRCEIVVNDFQRLSNRAQKRTGSLEITDYFFFFVSIEMTGSPAFSNASVFRLMIWNCSSR